jgi:hypothetical protein
VGAPGGFSRVSSVVFWLILIVQITPENRIFQREITLNAGKKKETKLTRKRMHIATALPLPEKVTLSCG